jgi:hypothetical protein
MSTKPNCVITEPATLRKMCSQPPDVYKPKPGQGISQKMRYSQIVNSVTAEGRRTKSNDISKVPVGDRVRPSVIVPPTNFAIFR